MAGTCKHWATRIETLCNSMNGPNLQSNGVGQEMRKVQF